MRKEDGDAAVTRDELRQELAALEGRQDRRWAARLGVELEDKFAAHLKGISLEIARALGYAGYMHDRRLERFCGELRRDIACSVTASSDQGGSRLGAGPRAPSDLAGRLAELERAFDEHCREARCRRKRER